MRKLIIIAASIVSMTQAVKAQDETDVLRFSLNNYSGSARAMAIGGAQGSIGADFTANLVNPGALARFSKSEFAFTPSFKTVNSTGVTDATTKKDERSKFNFDHIGWVMTNREKGRRNWKNTVFSIGMSRTADFHVNSQSSNTTTKSSLANKFVESINNNGGIGAIKSNNVSLAEAYAFNSYLVDTLNGRVISGINSGYGINQVKSVQSSGGIKEINMGLAGNFQDNLLLGASIGVPILNYESTVSYSEAIGDSSFVKNFNNTTTIATSGAGINLRLGAVYQPTQSLRLGLALHTPTYYQLTENSTYALQTSYNNGTTYNQPNQGGEPNQSEFTVTSPYKAVLSSSFLLGKYGFVTADYEYSNVSAARIGFEGNDPISVNYQARVNNVIKDMFRATNTVRLGAEARLNSLSLRAGLVNMSSPYSTSALDFKGNRTDLSAGIGFRTNSFFVDAALVNSRTTTKDYYYVLESGSTSPFANQTNSRNNVLITMGWKY